MTTLTSVTLGEERSATTLSKSDGADLYDLSKVKSIGRRIQLGKRIDFRRAQLEALGIAAFTARGLTSVVFGDKHQRRGKCVLRLYRT
ncbi:MAG: hypothetical protein ACLRSW_10515 [Christensenellaceae bacterium]